MSDRLKDLQRQRALAQEQLAWLDREIARETGASAPAPTPAPVPAVPVAVPPSSAVDARADEIIAQYRDEARPVHSEVKRGCLIYFFTAFALVGLGLVALYLSRRR